MVEDLQLRRMWVCCNFMFSKKLLNRYSCMCVVFHYHVTKNVTRFPEVMLIYLLKIFQNAYGKVLVYCLFLRNLFLVCRNVIDTAQIVDRLGLTSYPEQGSYAIQTHDLWIRPCHRAIISIVGPIFCRSIAIPCKL